MPREAYESQDPALFIAYSRHDGSLAGQLVAQLRSIGIGVLWDRDIPPGANYRRTIARWIKRADLVVILFTEHSVRSEWVTKEFLFALDYRRNCLPIRIGEPELSDELHLELVSTQLVEFPISVGVEAILDRVRTYLRALPEAHTSPRGSDGVIQ